MNLFGPPERWGILTIEIRRVGGPDDATRATVQTGPVGTLHPEFGHGGSYEPALERDGELIVYRWHEGTFDRLDRRTALLRVARDPSGGIFFHSVDDPPPAFPVHDAAGLRGNLKDRLVGMLQYPPDAADRWIETRFAAGGDPSTWEFWLRAIGWIGDQLKLPSADREPPPSA